jgi:hypothetical protein
MIPLKNMFIGPSIKYDVTFNSEPSKYRILKSKKIDNFSFSSIIDNEEIKHIESISCQAINGVMVFIQTKNNSVYAEFCDEKAGFSCNSIYSTPILLSDS